MAQKQDEEIINKLVDNYAGLIRGICRKFYLVGGTSDDLFQEGMIGLLQATKKFDETKGDIGDENFKKYATACIKHQILDAIKHSNTQKNQALNTAVPIVRKNTDDDEFEIEEIGTALDPEEMFLIKEKQEERINKLSENLSPFEKNVLNLYLQGLTNQEIAKEFDKTAKSIANTIQRIKQKVNK